MIKNITKFTSIFLLVFIFLFFMFVPSIASAADSDLTLSEPSSSAQKSFLKDGVSFRDFWLVCQVSDTEYQVFNFDIDDYTSDMYLRVGASDSYKRNIFLDSDSVSGIAFSSIASIQWNSNGAYYRAPSSLTSLYIYRYSAYTLSEFVDSVYYSSFDIYSDGIKIYDTSMNHNVTIDSEISNINFINPEEEEEEV